MVDLETLGTKPDSTIIQIAAASFNIKTGDIYSEFNESVDIGKNNTNNITGSTLKWWMTTNKDLFNDILSRGQYSSEDTLIMFHRWLLNESARGELHLWGNGILFDNNMIQHQFEAIGKEYPIHFTNDRDVRTLVELASMKLDMTSRELKRTYEDPNLIAHDALDDVKYQINLAVGCYNTLIQNAERVGV